MGTLQKYWGFKQKFIDPFIKIKEKSINRIQLTKDGIPLPSVIEISESGTCNRKCSFCPRSDPNYKDIKEFISDDLVNKLSSELSEFNYKGLILISGFVEPLLDKNIFNIIKTFRNKLPECKIEIVTNGDVLNVPRIQKLFNSGLSSFYISVYDGLEAENDFKKMIQESKVDPEKIKIRRRYLSEKEDFGITLGNRGGMMKNAEYSIPSLEEPLKNACYYPSYNFFVDYNGDVLLCSHDWGKKMIVGNMNNEKFFDIWCNKKFSSARKRLLNKDRGVSPCKECDVIGTLLGEKHADTWKKLNR